MATVTTSTKSAEKPAEEAKSCTNCELPLDKCKNDIWCIYCSGCGHAKIGCICAICVRCTKMRAECTCECDTCECSIKECVCREEDAIDDYCVYCMSSPCCCDAEYQEYMTSKDVCVECGEHYNRCGCNEAACGNCGYYHMGRKCIGETHEDDE
jgi:hypothetical protein